MTKGGEGVLGKVTRLCARALQTEGRSKTLPYLREFFSRIRHYK